jgi:SNF2 family DNA or RNA helicase
LVAFLRIQPFTSQATFQKFILDPLETDSPSRCRNIEMLLRALFLRRDGFHLKLPGLVDIQETVTLSPDERAAYKNIMDECRLQLEREVSKAKKVLNKYNILFMAMHRLRRYCNSGTFKFGDSDTAVCDTCNASDVDSLVLLDKEDICPDCGRTLGGFGTGFSLESTPKTNSVELPNGLGPSTPSKPKDYNGHSSKLGKVVKNILGAEKSDKRYDRPPRPSRFGERFC